MKIRRFNAPDDTRLDDLCIETINKGLSLIRRAFKRAKSNKKDIKFQFDGKEGINLFYKHDDHFPKYPIWEYSGYLASVRIKNLKFYEINYYPRTLDYIDINNIDSTPSVIFVGFISITGLIHKTEKFNDMASNNIEKYRSMCESVSEFIEILEGTGVVKITGIDNNSLGRFKLYISFNPNLMGVKLAKKINDSDED